jgi:hypothetical protein
MKATSTVVTGQRLVQLLIAALLALLSSACNKDKDDHDHASGNPLDRYSEHLLPETRQQLQDARTATQRYRSLDSAKADGYADISVVVENMGFHYMKASLADTIFDPKKPEILVYNKQHNGTIELVAVEYAVPIPAMPHAAPEGFAGPADVWTYSTTFNLWLLHAWVWSYNPLGVFVPNNPEVHLH